jgi:hypothetical protein
VCATHLGFKTVRSYFGSPITYVIIDPPQVLTPVDFLTPVMDGEDGPSPTDAASPSPDTPPLITPQAGSIGSPGQPPKTRPAAAAAALKPTNTAVQLCKTLNHGLLKSRRRLSKEASSHQIQKILGNLRSRISNRPWKTQAIPPRGSLNFPLETSSRPPKTRDSYHKMTQSHRT